LKAFEDHTSLSNRTKAIPLIFYRSDKTGFIKFGGYGIIDKIELVTQIDKDGKTFSNYAFDCVIFNLLKENESLYERSNP
jgi:hypothetical protein